MRYGWPAGMRTSAGANTSLLLWGLAACVGVAMLLAASPQIFTVLKYAGALYLGYLGARMLWSAWKHRPGAPAANLLDQHPTVSTGTLFRQGVIANLLNPRAAVFFTALLPQFITVHGVAAAPLIVGLTLITMTANATAQLGYAIAAHRTARLVGNRYFEPIMDSVVGSMLIAFGVKLALSRRV